MEPKWLRLALIFLFTGSIQELQAAQLTQLELHAPAKCKIPLQLLPPSLPHTLQDPAQKTTLPTTWNTPIHFRTTVPKVVILFEKQANKINDEKVTLTVPLKLGQNVFTLTAIDSLGNTEDFKVLATLAESQEPQDPKAFALVGPFTYFRSIERQGTGIKNTGRLSSTVFGVKGTYRHRLFKELTDHLPGRLKLLGDISAALGKSSAADASIQGWPRWADARLLLEAYHFNDFRIEAGFGLTHFSPGLPQYSAGDVENYFGYSLSGRVGHSIRQIVCLLGIDIGLQSSTNSEVATVVSDYVSVFISASIPRPHHRFWDLRMKFYQMNTKGTIVQAGTAERKERFWGPEISWVQKF